MIAALLEFSLRQRMVVLGLVALLSAAGIHAFRSISIDAYPDVTNVQVQVLTEAPGLSPVKAKLHLWEWLLDRRDYGQIVG